MANTEIKCAWCGAFPATSYYQNYPICTVCYQGLSVPAYTQCTKCGVMIDATASVCTNCERTTQRKNSQLNKCWPCANCRYEYNLEEKCLHCKQPRAPEEAIPPVGAVSSTAKPQVGGVRVGEESGQSTFLGGGSTSALLPAPSQGRAVSFDGPSPGQWSCYSSSTKWELWGCAAGHTMNTMQDLVCRTCDLVSSHPDASTITVVPTTDRSIASWVCFACKKRVNGKDHCEKCGCKRTWVGYLEHEKVVLDTNKTQWKCTICSQFNPLEEGKCSKCDKSEPAILRWSQPEEPARPSACPCCCTQ